MTTVKVPASVAVSRASGRLGAALAPRRLADGAVAASSTYPAKAMTSGGATHTPGSWTEIVASLSEDVGYVAIRQASGNASGGVDTSVLLDLGVGAAGAELVVLDSLGCGWVSNSGASHTGWVLPLFIPRGSRVAGRITTPLAATAISFFFEFFAPNGTAPGSKVTAIGADPASSRGTLISVPGSANVKGAWTEVTAATNEPYAALAISVQGGSDTTHAATTALFDVGVGASGSEVTVIPDLPIQTASSEAILPRGQLLHPVNVPKGSRLAVRYQVGANTGTFDVVLHGIRRPA